MGPKLLLGQLQGHSWLPGAQCSCRLDHRLTLGLAASALQEAASQHCRRPASTARRRAAVQSAAADVPTLTSQDQLQQHSPAEWEELFKKADRDKSGLIDSTELRALLEESNTELPPGTLDYIAQAAMNKAKAQSGDPDSRGLTAQEFQHLMRGGLLISHRLKDYWHAFQAADTSGNGTLSGTEVQALLEGMGQRISTGKLAAVMDKYDSDRSGQLDFAEFLELFAEHLLDLQELQRFLHMDASPVGELRPGQGKLIQAQEGKVTMVFTAEELDYLLHEHADKLTIVEASLTWCRPCMSFERSFEKFAEFYTEARFVKMYGNSNESTKGLFMHRYKIPKTPTFLFMRHKAVQLQYTGTRKEKLDEAMQHCLLPEENPLHEATPFKRNIWHSKLGVS